MKQIIAIVRPFLAEKVVKELIRMGVDDLSVREVKGFGRQKSYLSQYKENEYAMAYLPKIEISVWANDHDVDQLTRRIIDVSRTGRMGDGKIFVVPVPATQS